MSRFRNSFLLAGGLVAAILVPAAADVITLTDGSKLIGSVERMQDGKLRLVTKFAGTLEIDATMVATVETETPVNVGMDTGDRLVGIVEWKPDLDRAVVQTEFGGVPVAVDRIAAIWPRGGQSPEAVALEKQLAAERKAYEDAKAKWELTAEAGVVYTNGNTDTLSARGRVEARRKSADDLLRLYVTGTYAEQNEVRSQSEAIGGAYYEYLFTKRFFGFGAVEFEYDEFENLDLRASTSLGVGYYWIKEEPHELKTRGGLGYLHESYMNGVENDAVQADIGLDYRLDISPWLRFTHSTTWYPTFEGLNDYRLVSDTAFLIPLGKSDIWKLRLGAKYEYKSLPAAGRERLDQTYYGNIVLDLK